MTKPIYFTLTLVPLLLCCSTVNGTQFKFGFELVNIFEQLMNRILEIDELINSDSSSFYLHKLSFTKRYINKLNNNMNKVSRELESYEMKSREENDLILYNIMNKLPEKLILANYMKELDDSIKIIERRYKDFMEYSKPDAKFEIFTLTDFAINTISTRMDAIQDILYRIHDIVMGTNGKTIFYNWLKQMEEASIQMCNTEQSPQQLIYNLYKTIALTEIKGYAMMQFAFTFLKIQQNSTFTKEIKQTHTRYIVRAREMFRAVKTAMASAPRHIWKCDPSKHKPESTYTDIEIVQGFIVNEVDLNPQGTCAENCDYYGYTRAYGCYLNQFCAKQRPCNGKLVKCHYVDSDMSICPSSQGSKRRYEYIEYENGMVYGKKKTCSLPVSKVDSWWRWLFWHCSYCMCFCDNYNMSSHRYFNLREVISDIQDNKVITGMRMKKENQIIHIQIQQGILLPYADIDPKSVSWKNIDNYTRMDAKENIDYHTIMWEKRAVDLDDLESVDGHLLTGMRFRVIGAHLNLEIQLTPFNFTAGQLLPKKSFWHSYDTTEASEKYNFNGEIHEAKIRTELELNKPDIPTRSLAPSLIDSQSNQFILFQPTDFKKDAAQITVPFIDLQAVTPNPPVPLSGAGIFHKGHDGYGGFLALKAITYNFEREMGDEIFFHKLIIENDNANDKKQ